MSTTCICQSFSFDLGWSIAVSYLWNYPFTCSSVSIYLRSVLSYWRQFQTRLLKLPLCRLLQLDHGILEVFRAIVLAADNPVKEIGIILADFGLQEKFISKILSGLKFSFSHPFHIFYEGKYVVNSLKEDLKYV